MNVVSAEANERYYPVTTIRLACASSSPVATRALTSVIMKTSSSNTTTEPVVASKRHRTQPISSEPTIFTVTAMPPISLRLSVHHRTWGFYHTMEDAEDAVRRDAGGMNEAGSYPHCIIEEISAGIAAQLLGRVWFQWHASGTFDGSWQNCEKPAGWDNDASAYAMG